MRKCRSRIRLLLTKTSFLTTTLKLTFLLSFVALLFLHFQVKKEKETLIDLVLGNGNTEELVMLDRDTLVLNGYGERKESERLESAFTVIVVTSAPENIERRNIIRSSWGNKAQEHGAVVVFFLGMPTTDDMMSRLARENKQFHDLLIDDLRESYYALGIKTLRILKYFRYHHPKSKFLVKTDDDVFVNVPNVVHYLYQRYKQFEEDEPRHPDEEEDDNPKREYFVGGVIHSGRAPHTWNPFSKWYAPENVWFRVFKKAVDLNYEEKYRKRRKSNNGDPREVVSDGLIDSNSYPPYAEGNFYILSDDAANDILNVSLKVPMYHLEDVYVTGVLANWVLKIELEQIPMISSASNMFPRWSYFWLKVFIDPKDILAFHCDNHVDLITVIHEESKVA